MNSRNLRLALAGTAVAVVATLALMVSLWPDKKKEGVRRGPGAAGTNDVGAAGANGANSKLATAPKPNAPSNAGNTQHNPPAGPATKDINNTLTTPPIHEEIGKATVRDYRTGQTKEVPVAIQVMMLRKPDGTPLTVQGNGAMLNADGSEATAFPNAKSTGGPTSKPDRPLKK